ncbi:MAG: SDR family NAD(P)-dependent oxidoreductase [Betaproteobacteria bacterium]|nr:SDR family NAD(P)-dependent oxidoreductase [Betaproteobacteria bacterium]MDH3436160.1 SDR family NAD(P)-dependent oxidoreductase [Betaproteobacteria bacterium]
MADNNDTAVVVGAGPGLGSALVRRFARAGMKVAAARRDAGQLDGLVKESGAAVRAYSCDATDEGSVTALFAKVAKELGTPRLVAYNAGGFVRKSVLETSREEFERCWRNACLGGFLVGREAARSMLAAKAGGRHNGTIVFTGATASLRGGANFLNLAVGKFSLRALAQSMARELQPQGIHVAHAIIDGQIESDRPGRGVAERGADAVLSPAAIAEAYYQLHLQPPSVWTLEFDLRPYVEKF